MGNYAYVKAPTLNGKTNLCCTSMEPTPLESYGYITSTTPTIMI